MLFVSGPRIINSIPPRTNLARVLETTNIILWEPRSAEGAASPQLYYLGTSASGTPVALTGVLNDRLLASFGDEPVRRLPIVRLPPAIAVMNHGLG